MFGFGGIGKKRSKLGKWLDDRGITQQWLVKSSGVSRTTVSDICSDDNHTPNLSTIKKIMKALKKIDSGVKSNDFFDI